MANPVLSELPPFTLLDEPDLSFSPSDATQVDVHPLRGLLNYGPYSKGSFSGYTSRVRIATVGPESAFHRRGDLMKLLVHPSARGLGLARKLMQKVEEEAAKRGRTLLVLDTATGSEAEAIYPRLGWERVGVIPDYALFPDGRFCGTTLFYKRIG